jgi:hypothetical protein
MKKIIAIFLFIISLSASYAQSNDEIASVYMKRATKAIEEESDYKKATNLFEKGVGYLDSITDASIAKLGTNIYYKQLQYKLAKEYSKLYFTLEKDKNSEEYINQLDLAVTLDELVEKQIAEEKRLALIKRKKLKKQRKLDSLTNLWETQSKKLSIAADTIFNFDKNNYAIFIKNGKYGLITDKGRIVIAANGYRNAIANDGYVLFTNLKEEAFVLYCFNTNTGEGFLLPRPSEINTASTHYGKIMLPRGNGNLVTYPNKTAVPFVYNLKDKKNIRINDKETFFKQLKKDDVIEKFDKENNIRIDKVWYNFGGTLGGKMFPVYLNNEDVIHSFVSGIDGSVFYVGSDYQFIGGYYKNCFEALYEKNRVWIDQTGGEVEAPENEAGIYTGKIKPVKLDNGFYQFMKDGLIVLGTKTLETKDVFMKKYTN